jgi:hypothetical protein
MSMLHQMYKGYAMNATFPYQGGLLVPYLGHLSSLPQIVGKGLNGPVSVIGFGARSQEKLLTVVGSFISL